MALFAVGAHLALVDVGVTGRALCSDVCENRLGVALGTCHAFVHAAQRIARLVVVELRNCPDWLPAIRRVAVLARHGQIAVWTTRAFGGLRPSASRERGKREHDNEN